MFDIDTYNIMAEEEKAFIKWKKEQRDRILKIDNYKRKQIEWNKVFIPIEEPDDSYLEGGIY